MPENKPINAKAKSGDITKWFREMRSELKKVVWPTWKQVANNTWIVMSMIIATAIVIWIADLIMTTGTTYLITLGK